MGMDIDFEGNGRVSFFMKDCIDEFIEKIGEALDAKISSPAKKVIQNINIISPRLDKQEADTLNYISEKLLWLEKRGRPDIEPSI